MHFISASFRHFLSLDFICIFLLHLHFISALHLNSCFFFNPTLFLLYFLHFFFLFFLHFFSFFFLFFLYFFSFFPFFVCNFSAFFPPFSTFFFFCIHLYFLESRFTSLHFISAFLFSSIPAFQLHFIPALFICVSLLLPHIFSCFFFSSPSLPYCHSVSAFAFLVHIFPSALFTSRFHSFIPTPLFQHPHLHPSLPSLPTTCTPPSPEQSLPGGHSGTAFVRAAVRGTLTRRQLRSAPPSAAAQRCSPPRTAPGGVEPLPAPPGYK